MEALKKIAIVYSYGLFTLAVFALPFAIVGLLIFWLGFSQDRLRRVRDACKFDATKVFAVQIAKWRDEHGTDILNPYRRERDQLIQMCVKKDGKWCVIGDNSIWPGTGLISFAPKDEFIRWFYSEWYLSGWYPKDCY
jgi:hypothetical protein